MVRKDAQEKLSAKSPEASGPKQKPVQGENIVKETRAKFSYASPSTETSKIKAKETEECRLLKKIESFLSIDRRDSHFLGLLLVNLHSLIKSSPVKALPYIEKTIEKLNDQIDCILPLLLSLTRSLPEEALPFIDKTMDSLGQHKIFDLKTEKALQDIQMSFLSSTPSLAKNIITRDLKSWGHKGYNWTSILPHYLEIDPASALPLIELALNNPNPDIRAKGVECIKFLVSTDPIASARLLEFALKDTREIVMSAFHNSIENLAAASSELAIPFVQKMVDSENFQLFHSLSSLLKGLANSDPETTAEILGNVLFDDNYLEKAWLLLSIERPLPPDADYRFIEGEISACGPEDFELAFVGALLRLQKTKPSLVKSFLEKASNHQSDPHKWRFCIIENFKKRVKQLKQL